MRFANRICHLWGGMFAWRVVGHSTQYPDAPGVPLGLGIDGHLGEPRGVGLRLS